MLENLEKLNLVLINFSSQLTQQRSSYETKIIIGSGLLKFQSQTKFAKSAKSAHYGKSLETRPRKNHFLRSSMFMKQEIEKIDHLGLKNLHFNSS